MISLPSSSALAVSRRAETDCEKFYPRRRRRGILDSLSPPWPRGCPFWPAPEWAEPSSPPRLPVLARPIAQTSAEAWTADDRRGHFRRGKKRTFSSSLTDVGEWLDWTLVSYSLAAIDQLSPFVLSSATRTSRIMISPATADSCVYTLRSLASFEDDRLTDWERRRRARRTRPKRVSPFGGGEEKRRVLSRRGAAGKVPPLVQAEVVALGGLAGCASERTHSSAIVNQLLVVTGEGEGGGGYPRGEKWLEGGFAKH